MPQKTDLLVPVLQGQPVIPVLLIDKVEHAVPLARALAKGGLPAIEITLRTAAALDAIRAVASEVPEAIVGAGTILNAKQYEEAAKAGSRFIVSPARRSIFSLQPMTVMCLCCLRPSPRAKCSPFAKKATRISNSSRQNRQAAHHS